MPGQCNCILDECLQEIYQQNIMKGCPSCAVYYLPPTTTPFDWGQLFSGSPPPTVSPSTVKATYPSSTHSQPTVSIQAQTTASSRQQTTEPQSSQSTQEQSTASIQMKTTVLSTPQSKQHQTSSTQNPSATSSQKLSTQQSSTQKLSSASTQNPTTQRLSTQNPSAAATQKQSTASTSVLLTTSTMPTPTRPALCRGIPFGIIIHSMITWNGSLCCCDGFKGDEMSINLTITGKERWENALLEIRSPKAKLFHSRTTNELRELMKHAIGENMTDFK